MAATASSSSPQQQPYKNGNGNGNGNGNLVSYIAIALTFVLALGSAFWQVANPQGNVKQVKDDLQAEIVALHTDIAGLQHELSAKYPNRTETAESHNAINSRIERSISDIQRLYDLGRAPNEKLESLKESVKQREDRMDSDIKEMRQLYVRRDDLTKDIAAIHERLTGYRDTAIAAIGRTDNTVSELNKVVSGATTIGDQLKAIQKRQDDLDMYLRTHKTIQN